MLQVLTHSHTASRLTHQSWLQTTQTVLLSRLQETSSSICPELTLKVRQMLKQERRWLMLLLWQVSHSLTHSSVSATQWLTSSVLSTTCLTVLQTLCLSHTLCVSTQFPTPQRWVHSHSMITPILLRDTLKLLNSAA